MACNNAPEASKNAVQANRLSSNKAKNFSEGTDVDPTTNLNEGHIVPGENPPTKVDYAV